MLNTYTFTAGNKNRTESWYSGIVFHADGTFENTENQLVYIIGNLLMIELNFLIKKVS